LGLVAAVPDEETAFVDPAGLHHIQGNGPAGAGGAAGVIYRWLGISQEPSFPLSVTSAIQTSLQAKFHTYGERGEKKCIHVVGPDFRSRRYSRAEAVAELSEAYRNVMSEFCKTGLQKLRLLPVSGGIFSGPFKKELPAMTAEAVEAAFRQLTSEEQAQMLNSSVQMCVFIAEETTDFSAVFAA